MNRKASDQKRARVRRLLFCRLVALAAVAFFLLALQGSRSCVAPTLLVHVITCCRPDSLQRLLTSLVNAEYGVLRPIIDLNIEIDWVSPEEHSEVHWKTLEITRTFIWPHGTKAIRRRLKNAGLAIGWFELSVQMNRDYVMVLEDDVELSPHFYNFLKVVHCSGSLGDASTTAMCLHPNDWQIGVKAVCDQSAYSDIFYHTPEPCNWAPIWKSTAWLTYTTWLHESFATKSKPYVLNKNNMTYNYNEYVARGIDVQSPWVWRYNWEHSKFQVRYSFVRCGALPSERYFAINHKEPGAHFRKKLHLENDPSLLRFPFHEILSALDQRRNAAVYKPATFSSKLLIPRPH